MRGSQINIENSGGDSARASNHRNGQWKDANVLACPGFFRLRFGLASTGLTTEEHVNSDEKEQYATCYVECVKVNAEPVEQETSNQGEKRDDTSANECCSRDNEVALFFTEMSGQCDDDGRKSDWINDGEEGDKCANGECECCCCHGGTVALLLLSSQACAFWPQGFSKVSCEHGRLRRPGRFFEEMRQRLCLHGDIAPQFEKP